MLSSGSELMGKLSAISESTLHATRALIRTVLWVPITRLVV
jgi:hypothetical protein